MGERIDRSMGHYIEPQNRPIQYIVRWSLTKGQRFSNGERIVLSHFLTNNARTTEYPCAKTNKQNIHIHIHIHITKWKKANLISLYTV